MYHLPKQKIKRKGRLGSFKFFLLFIFFIFVFFGIMFEFGFLNKQKLISPIPDVLYKKNNQDQIKGNSIWQVEEKLRKSKIDFSSSSLASDSSYLVRLKSGETINFSSEKSLDEQISSLQLMLYRFTIEGKRLERLDFRFDKPVVVFGK